MLPEHKVVDTPGQADVLVLSAEAYVPQEKPTLLFCAGKFPALVGAEVCGIIQPTTTAEELRCMLKGKLDPALALAKSLSARIAMLCKVQELLTPSEVAVLRGLAGGLSLKEISEKCYLSYQTVRHAVSTACRKLGCANSNQLIIIAASVFPSEAFNKEGL